MYRRNPRRLLQRIRDFFEIVGVLAALLSNSAAVAATDLPAHYFELLNAGAARIEERLAVEPAIEVNKTGVGR